MIETKLDIQCIWGGTLTGVLLRNEATAADRSLISTTKIIAIHGWLDNLNSMLPLAKKLIDRHPNYEIYSYDRAGHGYASHIPKGFDYSAAQNLQDLRTVLQTLGWTKEKFIIIGHSYGAILGSLYAACYPKEVLCLVLLDGILGAEVTSEDLFRHYGYRIDSSIQFHRTPERSFDTDLTFEKALEVVRSTRLDITDDAARILTERSVRRDRNNKLYFTRDEALKTRSLLPSTEETSRTAVLAIKAFVLFIGATNPQWPRNPAPLELFKEHHPCFEMTLIDGPHHLHMTHVDQVVNRIERYFDQYLCQPSPIKSQL